MNTYLLACLAAIVMGIIVGAATFVTHFAIDQSGPITLAFFRYTLAIVFVLPFAFKHLKKLNNNDMIPIALLGIGQFGLLIILLNYAVQHIDPGRVTLIFALCPVITLLMGAAMGADQVSIRKSAGIILTIAGVAVSVGASIDLTNTGTDQWIGMAAVLGSAIIGAICSVLHRPYLQRNPLLPVSLLSMAAAVIFLGVLAGFEGLYSSWPGYNTIGWKAVLFIGAGSGVGYLSWLYALRHMPASNVMAFVGLGPPTAVVLSAIFLDIPLKITDGFGFVLILTGLYIALWQSQSRKPD
ncbi:MAG: DMT family transporter [Cohaesibacteraceae bacterium]|nr:DMT family transporter [Cohaesibacteraceae bacterium]